MRRHEPGCSGLHCFHERERQARVADLRQVCYVVVELRSHDNRTTISDKPLDMAAYMPWIEGLLWEATTVRECAPIYTRAANAQPEPNPPVDWQERAEGVERLHESTRNLLAPWAKIGEQSADTLHRLLVELEEARALYSTSR